MASFTMMKHTTAGACRGQVAHIYRTNEHYSNPDIQPGLSGSNVYLSTAAASRESIKGLIKALDEVNPPKRIKADRKTVAEFNFPAPREGMSSTDAMKFFNAVLDYFNDKFNVVGGGIHFDEIHDYIDPHDKQIHTSREHMHLLIVPEVEGKGCNMKAFATKKLYNELNKDLNRICREQLGYDYNDGTRQQSRGKVEELKIESALEAARQLPELQKQVDAEKAAIEAVKAEREAAEAEAATKTKQARQRVQQAQRAMQKLSSKAPEDILEERTFKTGFLQQETFAVAKEPELVKTAVVDAIAVQMHNGVLQQQVEQLQQQVEKEQQARKAAEYREREKSRQLKEAEYDQEVLNYLRGSDQKGWYKSVRQDAITESIFARSSEHTGRAAVIEAEELARNLHSAVEAQMVADQQRNRSRQKSHDDHEH